MLTVFKNTNCNNELTTWQELHKLICLLHEKDKLAYVILVKNEAEPSFVVNTMLKKHGLARE